MSGWGSDHDGRREHRSGRRNTGVDAAEQRLAVAVEDESGLDTTTSTRLKPVVVFVHVLNADGNLIWAELPSHMGFR
jgi:hypothetical protein